MDNIAMPVTIVVKAPNQQIEDQTIHCELNWTIKKLKGHLSEVYPSKPRLEDQKLIYSGQLLVDNVQLKDVLRTYEGQENHTVHLVCSPTRDGSKSFTSLKNSSTSVNSNSISSVNATASSSSYASVTTAGSNNIIHPTGSEILYPQGSEGRDPRELWAAAYANMGVYNDSNMANQMAWMQHVYTQYMNNYMQYVASNQRTDGNNGTGVNYAPYNGFLAPNAAQYNYQQPPYNGQQQQQANAPAVNNQQVQDNEDEEGRAHRDWLDWFYIMSRVLVLFSIVYFYSSPLRFLMVSTLGMIMYLYQVGFFRMQGVDGRGEVGGNNPRNAANAGVAPERENNNDRPNRIIADAAEMNDDVPDSNTPSDSDQQQDADAPPAAEAERPSLLTLTWTILCSFLLSLIPEQPNVI